MQQVSGRLGLSERSHAMLLVKQPFPFETYFFVLFGAADLGIEARWETDCNDCEGRQRQAGPVSHSGAFTPLDVSWPFPWGSRAAYPASVNTGPSVPFPVTRPLFSPPTTAWRMDAGECVRVCAS